MKKQLDEKNKTVTQNNNQNSSDYIVISNGGELAILRETIERLTAVGFLLVLSSKIITFSSMYRKIVIYKPLHISK